MAITLKIIPVKEDDIQVVQLVYFKGRKFPHSRDSLPKIPSPQKSWWTLTGRWIITTCSIDRKLKYLSFSLIATNTTGYIQYGFVARQVRGVNRVYLDSTRHDVYNELRRQARKAVLSPDAAAVLAATDNRGGSVVDKGAKTGNGACNKGGRPVGTTDVKKKVSELSVIAAINDICLTLKVEKKDLGKKRLRVGCLDEIICEAKERNGIPADYVIHKSTIRQQ